jgi:transcriptional regulator GlxA family with amidase domain
VLQVAIDAGFGSLSAFNKGFRNIAGMSPIDVKRETSARPQLPLI